MNKKYLPDGVLKLGRIIKGSYKSYQNGNSNMVATVGKTIEF